MRLNIDFSETVLHHGRNLLSWPKTNGSDAVQQDIPIYMAFNDGHKLAIIGYSILLVISTIANVTVLVLLIKRRKISPSRINTMLIHLAVADLMVTLLIMPLEIAWAVTVQWNSSDAMCRIMSFFRTFGLFLSSFLLICISIDRFYAVLKPLHLDVIWRREKNLLIAAWIGAVLCSLPQTVIFHLDRHPNITGYHQCMGFKVPPEYTQEAIYVIFGMVMMYILPLIVIIFSYSSILIEIFKRTGNPIGADSITRSSMPFLSKAKIRTLKMTVIIVFVFFVCWTPYEVMSVWYLYDRKSALMIDQKIQKGIFMFACTNSCMNPIVYGIFNIRARRKTAKVRPRTNTYSTNPSNLTPTTTQTRLMPLAISLKTLK